MNDHAELTKVEDKKIICMSRSFVCQDHSYVKVRVSDFLPYELYSVLVNGYIPT